MNAKQALKFFFEEKEIEPRTFAISHGGQTHMVESEFLQNVIVNHTPANEQERILDIIAQIDFRNGDVNPFLEHLARTYIMIKYGGDCDEQPSTE